MVRTSLVVPLSSPSVLIPVPQYFCNAPEALLKPGHLRVPAALLPAEFGEGKIPLRFCNLCASSETISTLALKLGWPLLGAGWGRW